MLQLDNRYQLCVLRNPSRRASLHAHVLMNEISAYWDTVMLVVHIVASRLSANLDMEPK